jgi:hypothetical protein
LFCVAIDQGLNVLKFNGSSWSSPPVEIEKGAVGKPSVSCPPSLFCAAVDDLGNAFTYDASSWASTLAFKGFPSDIAVNATSLNGADVTYQLPSATLGGSADPNASVTCVPPSGLPFVIGTTTVTCVATDWVVDNSPYEQSFTVTVYGPPTATITAPGNGGTYTQGQVVPTTFSCSETNGRGSSPALTPTARPARPARPAPCKAH